MAFQFFSIIAAAVFHPLL